MGQFTELIDAQAEITRLHAEVERLQRNVKYHMGLAGALMNKQDTAHNDAIEAALSAIYKNDSPVDSTVFDAIRALRKP